MNPREPAYVHNCNPSPPQNAHADTKLEKLRSLRHSSGSYSGLSPGYDVLKSFKTLPLWGLEVTRVYDLSMTDPTVASDSIKKEEKKTL